MMDKCKTPAGGGGAGPPATNAEKVAAVTAKPKEKRRWAIFQPIAIVLSQLDSDSVIVACRPKRLQL